MLKYMLDTDISIYVIKNRPQAARARFQQHQGQLCVSSVTVMELFYGVEKSTQRERNLADIEGFINVATGGNFSKTVKSVRFVTKSSWFWQKNFTVTTIPIDVVPQQISQGIIFSRQMTGLDMSRLHMSKDSASCYLDEANGAPGRNSIRLRSSNGYLQIKGWTAPPVRENDNQPIEAWIVVQDAEGGERIFKADVHMRPDVARHFNRPGLQTSGYKALMNLSDMPGQKKVQIKSISGGIAYNCPLVISVD